MSGFNGSGTFNISGVGLPYTSGTVISSSVANQLNTDLATGLSTCITRDGQSTISANIGWNNYNINNLSALGIGTAAPAGLMEVKSGSTTNFVIDATGNVGIGTSSPAEKLHVSAATNARIKLTESGSGANLILLQQNPNSYLLADNAFLIYTNSTERMRIDSSGNVGIGTSSLNAKLNVSATFGNSAIEEIARINRAGGTSVYASNRAAALTFYDENNPTLTSAVAGLRENPAGTYNGALAFYTNNTGLSAASTVSQLTERMRITSSGYVGIGTSNPAYKLDVIGTVAAGNGTIIGGISYSTRTEMGSFSNHNLGFMTNNTTQMLLDTSGYLLVGYQSSNGAYRLQVNSQIFATSSTIATSDGNYKENITPLSNSLNLICALNPVSFDWKQHPVHNFDRSTTTTGFIAQEVQQALQNTDYVNAIVKTNVCVLEPEEKDQDGNVTKPAVTEEFLGIAEGNLIALLTAAIKELKAELDSVKSEIATLKVS